MTEHKRWMSKAPSSEERPAAQAEAVEEKVETKKDTEYERKRAPFYKHPTS